MNPDANPGNRPTLISADTVAQMDQLLTEDPSKIPEILNAALDGDVIAQEYLAATHLILGTEGLQNNVPGAVLGET